MSTNFLLQMIASDFMSAVGVAAALNVGVPSNVLQQQPAALASSRLGDNAGPGPQPNPAADQRFVKRGNYPLSQTVSGVMSETPLKKMLDFIERDSSHEVDNPSHLRDQRAYDDHNVLVLTYHAGDMILLAT